jgi:FKBP-type peptidyl-prolyl cis-trans isomerase
MRLGPPSFFTRSIRSWGFALGLSLIAGLLAPLTARADLMPSADATEVDRQLPGARKLDGGIRFVVRKEGAGPLIAKGDRVTALYAGRFINGKIFNQKRSLDHSYTFEVGATPRQIILGWERAMLLMQAGGSYTIALPPAFAYSEKGRAGQVPPNTTILFDIDIVEVERAKK